VPGKERRCNMKVLNVLLVLFLITGFVRGKQVVDFPDLNNPNPAYFPIMVEGDRIYIIDGVTVYIYRAKDYKLIDVFGKKGEGPEEFKGYDNGCVMTSLTPDHIVIDSWGKLSFYSKDGVFQGELKMNASSGYVYRPFEDRYTAYYTDITNRKRVMGVLYLYDSRFNKIKELARYDEWVYQQKINPYTYRKPLPIVYGGKLFVNDYVDGTIDVFDRDGKLLYTINYNFKKVEVKKANKEETIRLYRTDPRVKAIFRTPEAVIKRLEFPGYFPVMKQYNISRENICAYLCGRGWEKRNNCA
jgi:hypothetical protein